MSSSNLEMKWNEIGKKFRYIGGLFILVIIPYIAFVALIIQLIMIILVINDLNDINRELKNPQLTEFRSTYLATSIFKFAGAFILHLAWTMMVGLIYLRSYQMFFPLPILPPVMRFVPIIVLFIIGFVLMIVGSSIEIGAWDNLKTFIIQNREIFPNNNGKVAIDGTEKLKNGNILWVLGFLVIPIIIGWIFHISGYFEISKIAEQDFIISKEPIKAIEPEYVYVSAPTNNPAPVSKSISASVQDTDDNINFCPLCGAKVRGGKYCGECGAQIRD